MPDKGKEAMMKDGFSRNTKPPSGKKTPRSKILSSLFQKRD